MNAALTIACWQKFFNTEKVKDKVYEMKNLDSVKSMIWGMQGRK